MLDTMTFTKTMGALCGALLVFMLGGWVAETLYQPHGTHGEQAYVIDTGADAPAAEAPAEAVDFEVLLASADPGAGERLWRQCSACHALEQGRNGTGPYLWGVVGRDKGSVEGFRYSAAMTGAEGAWEPENIAAFIENPRGYLAGTSMAYAGMRRAEDRANLIAYIATFGN
ncbi:MAG: c-type cytochrome [Gemmobacter sp.]